MNFENGYWNQCVINCHVS